MKPVVDLTMSIVPCEDGGVLVRHDTSMRVLLTLTAGRGRESVSAVVYLPVSQEKRLERLLGADKRYRLTVAEDKP